MFRARVLSLVCEGFGSRSRLLEYFRLPPEVPRFIGAKKIEIFDIVLRSTGQEAR
jgi:hypothetical protein